MAIAFTRAQLKYDRPYFTAEEVCRTFAFGIFTERREEVRLIIFKASAYPDIKAIYWYAGFSGKINVQLSLPTLQLLISLVDKANRI